MSAHHERVKDFPRVRSFDGPTLRDQGIEQAGSGGPVAPLLLWEAKAYLAIIDLSHAQATFTAEDVRRQAGEPPHPNVMGAVLRHVCKWGFIRPAGFTVANRPSRHASVLRLWCGV